MKESSQDHWNKIYSTKQSSDVSWTQEVPITSLEFFHNLPLDKKAAIIDIGGGESKLVDFLIEEGYTDLTVLDISEKALERTKLRLGSRAAAIQWIVCDITEFQPQRKYDVWHDRATFHFLTTQEQINKYFLLASHCISDKGYMIIATFSENGPTKCSGLPIRQYTEMNLTDIVSYWFKRIRCTTEDHKTPFQTTQNFLFCCFVKQADFVTQ